MMYAQNNKVGPLTALLRKEFSVDAKDDHGWTLLMVAACAGSFEIVKTLLKWRADTDIQDANGNMAVNLASIKGHRKVVDLINSAIKSDIGAQSNDDERLKASNIHFREFFCDLCQRTIKESTYIQHEASIAHQFNVGSSTSKIFYGISPSNKGYQLMVNQGWNAGKGFGPENSGVKFPVKTVLKRSHEGLCAPAKGKARMTHFRPGDESAVKGSRSSERIMRIKTLNKIDKRKGILKEARKERHLKNFK